MEYFTYLVISSRKIFIRDNIEEPCTWSFPGSIISCKISAASISEVEFSSTVRSDPCVSVHIQTNRMMMTFIFSKA